MASADNYRKQVFAIVGASPNWRGNISIHYRWETRAEAQQLLAEIREKQQRLRLLKKDVDAQIKALRSRYERKASSVSPGLGSTLLLGKGKAKSFAASQKREIRAAKDRQVAPFEQVKHLIDHVLVEMDSAKARLVAWCAEERARG